jgi:hypothetical protein
MASQPSAVKAIRSSSATVANFARISTSDNGANLSEINY